VWIWHPSSIDFRDLQGGLTCEKFFMTNFEISVQFYFQNDILKLEKISSMLGIRVFLENGFGSFQAFLILQI
jgi:hypothetical protein